MLYKLFAPFSFTDVSKALRLTISILLPASLLGYLGYLDVGLAIASGAFLVGITDTPGLLRHKIIGNGLSVLVVFLVFLLIGEIQLNIYFLSIIILLLSFVLSMLTIYGARGTNLAFSGLIALVLAMGGHSSFNEPLINAAWHGVGGLWYALLSITMYGVNPYHQTIDALGTSIRQIASYFGLRRALLEGKSESKLLMLDLLNKHVEISNGHEQIREVLLKNRSAISGRSNLSRSLVVLFIELVDLTDLALATVYNYDLITPEVVKTKPLKLYIKWVYSLEKNLLKIEANFRLKRNINSVSDTLNFGKDFKEEVLAYSEKYGDRFPELVQLLDSMAVFTDRVNRRIESISIAANFQTQQTRQEIAKLNLRKFQTKEDYSFQRFVDNLSLNSNFFRYAGRLSICLFLAFIATEFLLIQNAYWVLLTIIVIMRPSYGLTTERMYQRIVGTVVGGIVALLILFFDPPTSILLSLLSISIFLSFIFNNRNYRIGVFFTTLFVVFLYGIIEPELFSVVGLRVFDTIMGGAFAWIFNVGFLPAKEILTLPNLIQQSLRDNRLLFKGIISFKSNADYIINYKSLRKNATISNANSNSAFQKLLQEPDTKKINRSKWQELVTLNHTIYLAIISLYTVVNEKVTNDNFVNIIKAIELQLEISELKFSSNNKLLEHKQNELSLLKKEIFDKNRNEIAVNPNQELEDQLLWIYNLSSRMESISMHIKE